MGSSNKVNVNLNQGYDNSYGNNSNAFGYIQEDDGSDDTIEHNAPDLRKTKV